MKNSEIKNSNLKILVACHKPESVVPEDDIYLPIQVGKSLNPEIDLGFQCDNEGENISHKNASYCELTALYWAWKNLKNVDYIGLAHYRRYFDFKHHNRGWRRITEDEIKYCKDLIPDIKKLKENEVYLAQFWSVPESYWKNSNTYVIEEELYILYKIIEKYYPDYLHAFEKFMLGNRRSGMNMFIMSKKKFDKYCEWLFGILNKMEQAVSLSEYTSYKRLFGYLGELLLPVYCFVNKLKIKETKVAFCNGEPSYNPPHLRQVIKDRLYDISYFFENIPRKKSLKIPYWENYIKLDKIEI